MDPSFTTRVTGSKILPCKKLSKTTNTSKPWPISHTFPDSFKESIYSVTHSSNDFDFEEYAISFDKISTVITLYLVILGKPMKKVL